MPTCYLHIPADVYQFIQSEQAKIKIDKGNSVFSIESTINKLLRDHKKLLELIAAKKVVYNSS